MIDDNAREKEIERGERERQRANERNPKLNSIISTFLTFSGRLHWHMNSYLFVYHHCDCCLKGNKRTNERKKAAERERQRERDGINMCVCV